MQLFTEASAIADDINVSSWGHHYRTYNKMADGLANVAMDTGASVQAHATCNTDMVQVVTGVLILMSIIGWRPLRPIKTRNTGPRTYTEEPGHIGTGDFA